ncbi:hypothetical protein AQAU111925_13295 [Aquirufa aurantiipilula]
MVCVPPAVCVPVPVTTKRVATPEPIDTLPEVTAVPLVGVKVNVPVPTVPVNFIPRLDKLAIPLLKSPALDNLSVPDNPEMLPVKLVVTVILFPEASNPVTVLP